jgi:putative tryptophan/tyrosine transport system substrate-binding protein
MVEGKRVRLEFDPANATRAHKDSTQQRRTLAYVFLQDGTLLNGEIIKHGYGFVYTRFPFARMEEFRRQEEAREQGRGDCGGQISHFRILIQNISGQAVTNISNNRRMKTVLLLMAFILASVHHAEPQHSAKIPRIGYLSGSSFSANRPRNEAFRQGLRELGYVEGKNISIEWRSAEGKFDRLPALAAELVRLKVDVIVSAGPAPTRALKSATNTIPIVFAQEGDPVAGGLVASLARPGGNITGLAGLGPELSRKRLELLKEIIPTLSRAAVLRTSTQPGNAQMLKELDLAAEVSKVKLQYLDVLDPKFIETAFQTAVKGRVEAALMMVAGAVAGGHQTEIVELAVKNRLPVIYATPRMVDAGGLMSYGVNINALDGRAATYVDKILKGRTPADLPVEQPTKFELIINMKTARQIGLTIPPNVLARADKVIK